MLHFKVESFFEKFFASGVIRRFTFETHSQTQIFSLQNISFCDKFSVKLSNVNRS